MDSRNVDVAHSWKAEQWDWPLQQNDGVVRLTNTNEKFEVALDAAFFTPKDIQVKVTGNQLVIHCMHETRTDQFGEVKREVNRTYLLPDDVDTKTLKSNLTTRGYLVITASKKAK
uniref:SHSP domain-containing protein n=1 Tax=Syphacia muris TaxID=451379 RepID=A0A0N5AJ79_9BILA